MAAPEGPPVSYSKNAPIVIGQDQERACKRHAADIHSTAIALEFNAGDALLCRVSRKRALPSVRRWEQQ